MRNKLFSGALALLVLVSGHAMASGSYGGGGGGGSFNNTPQQRQVDPVYEQGKAIYRGRKSGEPSLNYCVVSEGEKVPVKRSSIRSYKKTSYQELAQNLYNCDNPESLVADELTRDSLLYVLYYLNKRHRLNLRGSS